MPENRFNPWLHRFAILVALSALGLIAIGGLVTSHGVGMAVPDWPTSFGYNMFALPFSLWLTGGVFHEHTHRQWASIVGVLVVILTRWLGGRLLRVLPGDHSPFLCCPERLADTLEACLVD